MNTQGLYQRMMQFLWVELDEGEKFSIQSATFVLKEKFVMIPTKKQLGHMLNEDDRFGNIGRLNGIVTFKKV